jgi:hypothetical protein
MRKHLIALVAVIALVTLGGSAQALAQTANRPSARRVFGFQDSKTGTFHPLGNSADITDAAAATTTYTGTVEATGTITLKTARPSGDKIVCTVTADASSENETAGTVFDYDESASSIATVSGSTATCKVNIPFSWVLFTPSTTVINGLQGGLEVIMFSPTATVTTELAADFVREHTQPITINAGKPADGVLTVAVAVTL